MTHFKIINASKIYSLKQLYHFTIKIYLNLYEVFVFTSQRIHVASIRKKTVNVFWGNRFRSIEI